MKQQRVFVGVMEICGYYGALTVGLLQLGAVAHFLDVEKNKYGYRTGQGSHWIAEFFKLRYRRFHASRSLSRFNPRRYLLTAEYLAALWLLVAWMGLAHDIIVLKSGIGLMTSRWDLAFFRLLGRTVIFIYHGSDSRPAYLNGGYVDSSSEWLIERTAQTKREIDASARYATYVVDNPLSGLLHDRPVCVYQIIGAAIESSQIPARGEPRSSGSVRVLHAPSLPRIKGTDRIRNAITSLKQKGFDIDYVELVGVPNTEVMQQIARCDVVVDELYSDTPGAMFAIEACTGGRPCIVGGYGYDELKRWVPEYLRLPTYFIHPDKIEAALEVLIGDSKLRAGMTEAATQFIATRLTPGAVAQRLLALATAQAPPDWFYNPDDVQSVAGCGGQEHEIRRMVGNVIRAGGMDALCLQGKEKLVARLVAFSGGRVSEQDAA